MAQGEDDGLTEGIEEFVVFRLELRLVLRRGAGG